MEDEVIKKPVLDLSQPNCHVCGSPLVRDMKNLTERCIHYNCQVRNVDFSIRTIVEDVDDSKS